MIANATQEVCPKGQTAAELCIMCTGHSEEMPKDKGPGTKDQTTAGA